MGYVVFSLLSIALGLNARSETKSIFSRELFLGWRQIGLFALALFFVFLGTFLLQSIFNTTPLRRAVGYLSSFCCRTDCN